MDQGNNTIKNEINYLQDNIDTLNINMDIIDKSKALNILVPSLINKNENLTKEIKTRIK